MSLAPRLASDPTPQAPALVGIVDNRLSVSSDQERSFASIYEALFPRLCAFAVRFLSQAAAEDVVQQAMAELWGSWPLIVVDKPGPPYFFRAVRNGISNYRRDTHRHNVRLAQYLAQTARRLRDQNDPEAQLERAELAAVLDAAVAGLPDRCREAFILVRDNEFTYKQAAAAMDVATDTVKKHLISAQKVLREAITDAGYHEAARSAMKQIPSATQENLND